MSNKTQTQKFIDYFQNLDEALKDGKVKCVIKIGNDYFPQSMSTTIAPCLCEFTNDEIVFNSCNTGAIFWKNTIKFLKKISYKDIAKINLAVERKLNAVLGVFPTYFFYLQIGILLNNNEEFSLECDTFEQVPELFQIFNMNKVQVIDNFNLYNIYKDNTNKTAREYIENNYEDMIKKVKVVE